MQARDARLFDLGLVIGVQVKTGRSYFRERVHDDAGRLRGWWFRDSDRSHVDDWAAHGLPHLLVLHDLESRTSYWVHVTPSVIVETGRGAKVLVESKNVLDAEHSQDLLEIAGTLRPGSALEGSAWGGSAPPRAREVLRYALVVPRLIAPHPNADPVDALAPEQAVALLMQARLSDLAEYARRSAQVPALQEAAQSPQWSWRFVGALAQFLQTDAIEPLVSVLRDAPDAATRTASIVTAASALLTEDRADEAVALIEGALADDDAEPVDHAWLTVQHARACAEIGRIDEARAEASAVQAIRAVAPDDVTATAIAGSAALLLFRTADWGEHDIAGAIAGADTAAGWWSTQTMGRGLSAMVERAYRAWSGDRSVTIAASDVANNQLVASALLAAHVGDQGDWRYLTGLLGRDKLLRLDRGADAPNACDGLRTLRLAGDERALMLATQHFVADGPSVAVRLAATEIDLTRSTRTSGRSNLALVKAGADVLDRDTADRMLTWLLETLADPSSFVRRTSATYLVEIELADTLAAVIPALDANGRRAVVDRVLSLPGQEHQMWAESWARVVDALPDATWTPATALVAANKADDHHAALQISLLRAAALHHEGAKRVLLDRARDGSLDALAVLGPVGDLSADVVTAQVALLAEGVEQEIREAEGGSVGLGGHDCAQALALLNGWHPELAVWEPLLAWLTSEAIPPGKKRYTLHALTSLAADLPVEIQRSLAPIAVAVADQPASAFSFFRAERDAKGASTCLAVALHALDDQAVADRILDLVAGDAEHRQWAAHTARRLGRGEYTGMLLVLATDEDPDVRAAAASALASLLTRGQGGDIAATALRRCVDDPGTRVPRSIAMALSADASRVEGVCEVLDLLRTHVSARVRALCGQD